MEVLCSQTGCACDQSTCNLYRTFMDGLHEEVLDVCQCHLAPLVQNEPDMFFGDLPNSAENTGVNWGKLDRSLKQNKDVQEVQLLKNLRGYGLLAQIRLTLRSDLSDGHKVSVIERLINMQKARMKAQKEREDRVTMKTLKKPSNDSLDKTRTMNSSLTLKLQENLQKLVSQERNGESKNSELTITEIKSPYNLRQLEPKIQFKDIESEDDEDSDGCVPIEPDTKKLKLDRPKDSEEVEVDCDPTSLVDDQDDDDVKVIDEKKVISQLPHITIPKRTSNILRRPPVNHFVKLGPPQPKVTTITKSTPETPLSTTITKSVPQESKSSPVSNDLNLQPSALNKNPLPPLPNVVLYTNESGKSIIAPRNQAAKTSNIIGGGNIKRQYQVSTRPSTTIPVIRTNSPIEIIKPASAMEDGQPKDSEDDKPLGVGSSKRHLVRTYSRNKTLSESEEKVEKNVEQKNGSDKLNDSASSKSVPANDTPKANLQEEQKSQLKALFKNFVDSKLDTDKFSNQANMARQGEPGKRCLYHPLTMPIVEGDDGPRTQSHMLQPPKVTIEWKRDIDPDVIYIKLLPPSSASVQSTLITEYCVFQHVENCPVDPLNNRKWNLLYKAKVNPSSVNKATILKVKVHNFERRYHYLACSAGPNIYSPWSPCVNFIRPSPRNSGPAPKERIVINV